MHFLENIFFLSHSKQTFNIISFNNMEKKKTLARPNLLGVLILARELTILSHIYMAWVGCAF